MITTPGAPPHTRLAELAQWLLDREVSVDALVLSRENVREMREVCEEAQPVCPECAGECWCS